jgi:PIN domain nuclease of toxin-antitoxin system
LRLLLDTHTLLSALAAPARLPASVAADIREPQNEVFASAPNIWEISIKAALGKVDADVNEVARALGPAGFRELPITVAHARRVATLAQHHRDPFDRILISQAIEEGLVLVTRDPEFGPYKVATLWA